MCQFDATKLPGKTAVLMSATINSQKRLAVFLTMSGGNGDGANCVASPPGKALASARNRLALFLPFVTGTSLKRLHRLGKPYGELRSAILLTIKKA